MPYTQRPESSGTEGGSTAKQLSKLLGNLLQYPVQYETAQGVIDYVDHL